MTHPSRQELLAMWDAGHHDPAESWARQVLAKAGDCPAGACAPADTLGRRDARLLAWRNRMFGRVLRAADRCPQCGEHVELDLDGELLLQPAAAASAEQFTLAHGGHVVRFRLPACDDMEALARCPDEDAAEALLLRRCIVEATRDGLALDVAGLPVEVVDALSERMAELDPQADTRLRIRCPQCGREWSRVFDVVSFLWEELDGWTRRILDEVHRLATAYGWSEADILALGSARRRVYLSLVGA